MDCPFSTQNILFTHLIKFLSISETATFYLSLSPNTFTILSKPDRRAKNLFGRCRSRQTTVEQITQATVDRTDLGDHA